MSIAQLRNLNVYNFHGLLCNTFHGISMGRNAVGAYYLLRNKQTETTYIEMLNWLMLN